ncbi:kinase-like domain-containing protein [Melanogaster broomeanus]|nr:kinase-like domain-containing protein [Melanogaster broomeanus]
MVRRELGIWRRLEHNNIVPFLGIVYGFGRCESASLVSLWMHNGTLQSFLARQDGKLTVAHQLQLVPVLRECPKMILLWTVHSCPIIHGDLNCNNVLLDENFNARLADFGYASLLGEVPEALIYLQMSTMRPGAVRWAAPEQIIPQDTEETVQPTTKSDIYSFGNVFSGKLPWSEVGRDTAVSIYLSQGRNPGRPKSRPIDEQHWEFINRCWANIQERPPVEDIVSALQRFLASHPRPPSLGHVAQLANPQPASGDLPLLPTVQDNGNSNLFPLGHMSSSPSDVVTFPAQM